MLFVYYHHLSSFMARDWEIVRAAFPESRLFRYSSAGDAWSLRSALRSADLCLAWFCARHALAAACVKPRRVPLVVVAGGFDVARMPDIGYGSFSHPLRAAIARRVFARAARVLAVSDFTARLATENAGVPPDRLRVIHHGFDAGAWPMAAGPRKIDAFTAVKTELLVKGIDLILGAAAALPDRRFEIVGPRLERGLRRLGLATPPNVTCTGLLSVADLRRRFADARVYLQPSRHESFGCALAEAMLTGCVPVVTRAGALPEVVGDAGFYAEDETPDAVTRALQAAWAAPQEARAAARRRIETEFALDRYAEHLIDCLSDVAG